MSRRRRSPAARVLALGAIVAWGCVATPSPSTGSSRPPTPPPSDSASASADESAEAARTAAPPAATSTAGAIPDRTPLPDLQPRPVSPARITMVCEDWGSEPPAAVIGCANAMALALAAIGVEAAASTRRLDFRFGDGCDRAVPCAERRADVGWVVARSATYETLGVRVALDPTGELRAWPPVPGPVEAPPAFAAPAGGTPDLGADLPAKLRERRPVPFCGAEDLSAPDAFASAARTCFLRGVLAGVPVELVSRSFSTEGHALLTLYRFTGQGAVLHYVRTTAGWTGSACGISAIRTRAVFVLAGTCERLTW